MVPRPVSGTPSTHVCTPRTTHIQHIYIHTHHTQYTIPCIDTHIPHHLHTHTLCTHITHTLPHTAHITTHHTIHYIHTWHPYDSLCLCLRPLFFSLSISSSVFVFSVSVFMSLPVSLCFCICISIYLCLCLYHLSMKFTHSSWSAGGGRCRSCFLHITDRETDSQDRKDQFTLTGGVLSQAPIYCLHWPTVCPSSALSILSSICHYMWILRPPHRVIWRIY